MAKTVSTVGMTRIVKAIFVVLFLCASFLLCLGDYGVTEKYDDSTTMSPSKEDSNLDGTLTSDIPPPGEVTESFTAPSTETSDTPTPAAEQVTPSPPSPSAQPPDSPTPVANQVTPSPPSPSTQTPDTPTPGAEQVMQSSPSPSTQAPDTPTPGVEQVMQSPPSPTTQAPDTPTPGVEQMMQSPPSPTTQAPDTPTPGVEPMMQSPPSPTTQAPDTPIPGVEQVTKSPPAADSTGLPHETETTMGTHDLHSVTEQEDSTLLDEETSKSETPASSTESQETGYTSSPVLLLGEPELRSLYSLGERNVSADLRLSQCGGRGRIIGGLEAAVGSWPWAVVVKDKFGAHYCGGALISSQHILTAAHCIEHPDLADRLPLQVTVGEHDISRSDESVSRTEWVHQALSHSQYNYPSTHNNDVAVLVVQNAIDGTDNVAPACLPSAQLQLPVGTKLYVVGWGATMENGPVVDVLRQVQVTLLSHSACAVYNEYRQDRMFCVGDTAGGKDACQGDSGGPLLYHDGSKWYVVGVVSFGIGCGRSQYPGVYTSVPFHLGLITWALDNA